VAGRRIGRGRPKNAAVLRGFVATSTDATAAPTVVAGSTTIGAVVEISGNPIAAWTAEGGTNTTGITTGNSGGASGTAFDSVSLGTGATATYDNTQARGSLAAKLATAGTAADCSLNYAAAVGALTQGWFRAYLYVPSNPGTQHRLIDAWDSTSGNLCFALYLTAAGKLMTVDTLGATISTTTASVPLSSWFRVELAVVGSATVGQTAIRLYNTPDSVTFDESLTSAATKNTRGSFNQYRFGSAGDPMPASRTLWIDNLGVGGTGWLGPTASATITPTVVAGTTTIGATTVQAGSKALPAVVSATTTIGAPVLAAGSKPVPAVVAGVATVGTATVTTGSTAVPTVVSATTTIGGTASASSTATPTVVAGTTVVGTVIIDSPPTTPAGLTSTAIRATDVDLSWSASTDDIGVAYYELMISRV
jgi:hypothetical protein